MEHPLPKLAQVAGVGAFVGVGAIVLTDLVSMVVVPGYSPVAETMSDLGAGPYSWIQDTGFATWAMAHELVAVALLLWRPRAPRWAGGAVALLVMGISLLLIGFRDEYGDGDTTGHPMHMTFVYTLGLSFPLAAGLLARGLGELDAALGRWSLGLAGLWLLAAPPFLLLPTDYDGLYERLIALVPAAWLLIVGRTLVRASTPS